MSQHSIGSPRPLARAFAALWALLVLGLAPLRGETPFPPELVDFEPYAQNPIFTGAGSGHWDAKIRERGWIMRQGDAWHLWYTGYDGSRDGIKQLGYATSSDGLAWTRFKDNPLDRGRWIEDMMVARDGRSLLMVAEGRADIAQWLTSPDMVAWQPHGSIDVRTTKGVPISPGPYGTPTLWHEVGPGKPAAWYLFYERGDKAVWLARSEDLKQWTLVSDEPVLRPGPEAYDRYAIAVNQVVKYGGRYYAYYHAADTPEWRRWSTNVATSEDLVHWTKYQGNPLVGDNQSSGILVDDGRRFRLYTMHADVRIYFSRVEPRERLKVP